MQGGPESHSFTLVFNDRIKSLGLQYKRYPDETNAKTTFEPSPKMAITLDFTKFCGFRGVVVRKYPIFALFGQNYGV